MHTLILIPLIAVAAIVATAFLARALASGSAKQTFNRPQRVKSIKRQWRKIHLLPLGLARLRTWLPGSPGNACSVQFANIGDGVFENGRKSYLPDATTASRCLLYKIGTDGDHCAITGAGDTPLGSSDDQADSTSTPITLNLFGAVRGTVRVVTDGTVNNGDRVKAGATGKVTQAATTDVSFGIAIIGTDCTKADGDVITIIPCIPQKYVF